MTPIDIPAAPHTTHSFMPDGQCRYKGCNAILEGPYIRSNIKRILDKVSEHSATDSEATTDTASLPSSSDTLGTILTALLDDGTATIFSHQRSGHNPMDKLEELKDEAHQQIKEWAYQETLNLINEPVEVWLTNDMICLLEQDEIDLMYEVFRKQLRAKVASKWGKQ